MAEFDKELYMVKALDLRDKVVKGFFEIGRVTKDYNISTEKGWVSVNPYSLCRNTGIKIGDCYLYENDIVSYFEPMRDKKQYGFIDFDDFYKCYIVRTGIETRATRLLKDCAKIENTGKNISLNDDDFKWFVEWEKSEWEKSKSYVIDNSYCPSMFKK